MTALVKVTIWTLVWSTVALIPAMLIALNFDDCAAGGRTAEDARLMLEACVTQRNWVVGGFVVVAGGIWLAVTVLLLARGAE